MKTSKTRTRNNRNKKNKTCKNVIGLKPFEEQFSKTNLNARNLKITMKKSKETFIKKLLAKFAPNEIKPKDNFYDYINYNWLKNISIEEKQKYITQIDNFRLVQDKVYTDLSEIILNYIKTHNDKLSKNLKNFYNSVIEMNTKADTRQLAKEAEELINTTTRNKDNVWKLLAYFNSDEMISSRAPFTWSLNPDDKNPDIFRCYIEPYSFEIVDIEVYYDDGTDLEYKKKYKSKYIKSTQKIFDTLLGPNNYNAQDVYDVELDILHTFDCVEVLKNETEIYNKVYTDEALTKYGFNWREFTKELGFKTTPPFFITSSLNYLKCCSTLLVDNWNTPKWKTFWLSILLKRLARITKGWETMNFDFSGKFEKGQELINKSDAVSAALYMSVPFNTFLTNQYVAKYENPHAMEYVKTLCSELKIVFKRILQRNTWLAPSTKKYALKKLQHFNFIFGKPENLSEDPLLCYGNNLYDNLKKIMDWRNKKFTELDGKPVIDIPMMDWTQYPVKMVGTQAYIVNASYTPSKNAIYINLGSIQKPFVDLDERGIEYNLAHIGYTIGHEMSHGFDDLGSQYGYDGKLYNWWTDADKRKYKAIQNDVIKQYEEFAARDGIKFDASIGIGEDLADISGLAICDEYLQDFQENNKDLIPIRNLSYEAFYVYFAMQQRQKVDKKALAAQLKTNPHPLDKYRCNIPLCRSDIFRAIYNVKKGDDMWWHNSDTIW